MGGRDVGLREPFRPSRPAYSSSANSILPLAGFTKWTCPTGDADYRLISLLAFGYRVGEKPLHMQAHIRSAIKNGCHVDKSGTFKGAFA